MLAEEDEPEVEAVVADIAEVGGVTWLGGSARGRTRVEIEGARAVAETLTSPRSSPVETLSGLLIQHRAHNPIMELIIVVSMRKSKGETNAIRTSVDDLSTEERKIKT